MGLLDFLKDAGKDIIRGGGTDAGVVIEREIERTLGNNIQNLQASFSNGVVTLRGTASSEAAKEKAALIAGNVRGVNQVNDDGLTVSGQTPAAAGTGALGGKETGVKTPPGGGKSGGRFYTVQSGDTLSKIAKDAYGDANKWQAIFDANKEVIEDADKIYPGQQIRLPADL